MDFGIEKHHIEILQRLVLTENCLIAEIYRLSDQTSRDFIDPTNSHFQKLIVDFSYFENKSVLENFIENSEVKENNLKLIFRKVAIWTMNFMLEIIAF